MMRKEEIELIDVIIACVVSVIISFVVGYFLGGGI